METGAQRRKRWQREEAIKRSFLRPLRDAVNLALRRAGIPHEHTIFSSRVKGWPTHWDAGYETESDTFNKVVVVRIWSGRHDTEEQHEAMKKKAWDALVGKFQIEDRDPYWIVSGMKEENKP